MTVEVEELLQRVALEDQNAELARRQVRARVRRRRRRRAALRGVAVAAVAAVAGVAAVQLDRTGDGDVVASGDAEPVAVLATALDGQTVMISLPAALGRGYEVSELNAGLTLGNQGWAVTVTRTSDLSVLPPETCDEPQQTAVGTSLDGWAIEISGDGFTPTVCPSLLAELGAFEVRDGIPRYIGDGSIGPIDGPDVAAVTDTVRLSLFHRPCSMPGAGETTSGGLSVSRVDRPARQPTVTVLCDHGGDVELWIQAPTWPSKALLDRVEIDTR